MTRLYSHSRAYARRGAAGAAPGATLTGEAEPAGGSPAPVALLRPLAELEGVATVMMTHLAAEGGEGKAGAGRSRAGRAGVQRLAGPGGLAAGTRSPCPRGCLVRHPPAAVAAAAAREAQASRPQRVSGAWRCWPAEQAHLDDRVPLDNPNCGVLPG